MFLIKKYIKKNNKNAFSLIELSIVILVISVMVVGVATGKSLITKSRLANAKSLTRQSVVNDMGDDGCTRATCTSANFTQDQANHKQDYESLWFKVK